MKTKTFEEFLKDIHANDYSGTDDDMPDAFEMWLEDMDIDEMIDYADTYGEYIKKEITKQLHD